MRTLELRLQIQFEYSLILEVYREQLEASSFTG
jgi:hypothetical protein